MNKSHANTSTCTKPTMSFCRVACWMKFTFSPWRHHWRTTATCIVVNIPCAPQFENCFTWFQEYVIEATPATTNPNPKPNQKNASPGYEQKETTTTKYKEISNEKCITWNCRVVSKWRVAKETARMMIFKRQEKQRNFIWIPTFLPEKMKWFSCWRGNKWKKNL